MSGRKRRSAVRRTANTVMIICLLVVAAFSSVKLYQMYSEYSSDNTAYRDIAHSVEGENDSSLKVDFDKLRKINPDIVGWIRYKGTPIDYPVVQGRDNNKYLHTRFDGSYSECGTLFVDAVTDAPFEQFNTIIYGHHMQDGSMFGSLKKLRDPEFCRKHPKMELATPEGNYNLEILAFLNQPSDSRVFINNVSGEEDKAEYSDWIKSRAVYTTDTDISAADRLVILSTCAYEYSGARYIVICRICK